MDVSPITRAFETGGIPLIRTDFRDDAAWQIVAAATIAPVTLDGADPGGGDAYEPQLVIVDDRSFDGVTAAALGAAVEAVVGVVGYALLADARSMVEAIAAAELTLEWVDLSVADPEDAELFDSFMGRSFRCTVSEVASIEANLSLANMDFSEFADHCDPDGVFRGFADL